MVDETVGHGGPVERTELDMHRRVARDGRHRRMIRHRSSTWRSGIVDVDRIVRRTDRTGRAPPAIDVSVDGSDGHAAARDRLPPVLLVADTLWEIWIACMASALAPLVKYLGERDFRIAE